MKIHPNLYLYIFLNPIRAATAAFEVELFLQPQNTQVTEYKANFFLHNTYIKKGFKDFHKFPETSV
jgi:hypothetical protein